MSELIKYLLNIFSEITLINASVWPYVTSKSAFFIVLVRSHINVKISLWRHPISVSISHSFEEITLINWAICPRVLSFSVEFSFSVFSFVFISVHKDLCSISLFHRFEEGSLVVFILWKFQKSIPILFTVFPFSFVSYFCSDLVKDSLPIFNAFNPLAIVNVSIAQF